MTQQALIGIDIGTSSVKAVMAASDGTVLARFGQGYATERPASGAALQAPEDWVALVMAALDRFARHPDAAGVVAIGITSQVNTHVFCDAAGMALAPAITWQDTRAAPDGATLDARITTADKTRALGAPIPIDASHALARMALVARTAPEVWAATRAVMLPKDYVIARLTGEVLADPLAAVGLVGADLGYADAVLGLIPEAAALLPPLRDPLEPAGRVRPGLPFAGVPVAVGTMDAWASMFGLGVAREGEAMYLSGSSEVLGLISTLRTGAPGPVTFPEWRGITLHAAPTQAGGASLDWLSGLLGRDAASLDTLSSPVRIGRASPLFLPHLEGERAPLWDPQSRGAFAGLNSATGPAEMTAAVMEGVAFSARLALESLEASGGRRIEALALGGGGARSDSWNRLRADALGRPLRRIAAPESGALGALVMAGVACGQIATLEDATHSLVATDATYEPDPGRAALADERFAHFRQLYASLCPIHHAMT
ncbi:FGGY-family carbohydrate kinase [Tropicimonas sp. IMCC34043]|uniref:xylulokinase n=1 Tax=Tropicimonas sp. IMCC34043 TaxID=2248760 RepID=UPI000E25A49C|nr:FGGY-family carbohydrate kinase [Tropicimonas sp. IMCC34043]